MPRAKKSHFDMEMTQPVEDTPVRIDMGNTDDELDTLLADFPSNESCIEISRTTKAGGAPAFLEIVTPAMFSFAYVCEKFGGGKYIIKCKYKGGKTEKRSFEIEGDPFPVKRKVPQILSEQPVTAASPSPAPVHVAHAPVEVSRRDDGSYDVAALMASMMGMIQKMMVESRGSKAEWLQEMKDMREIFGHQERPQTPVQEAIGMIKTGIELGSSGGGEPGGIPWLMIADKLQGPLTDLAQGVKFAMMQPRGGAVPVQSHVPYSQPVQPNPPVQAGSPAQPQATEGQEMEIMLMGALRQMLPMLVTGAAQGTVQGQTPEESAGFYCDFLLDQIPVKYYDTAKTLLERPDCVDRLASLNPGVRAYRPWFEQLQGELYRAILERLGHAAGSVQPEQTSDHSTNGSPDI